MTGRILFFGKLQDMAGHPHRPAPHEAVGGSVKELIALISQEHPELGAALKDDSVRVCINQELLAQGAEDHLISSGDEIAMVPFDLVLPNQQLVEVGAGALRHSV